VVTEGSVTPELSNHKFNKACCVIAARLYYNDMNKVEKLLAEIKQYNEAYRTGNAQISDKEYDKLVKELKRIDPDNEWFKHIEPAPVSKRRKVKLPIPMKSLNKVKDIGALKNWAKSIGLASSDFVVITPKFDGLSLLHNEKTGKAYSRGGAENEGQDCTAHYQAAINVNNTKTPIPFTFGEFVFSHKSWMTHFYEKTAPDTGDKKHSRRITES
jgi:DNA ligase (NAD+)